MPRLLDKYRKEVMPKLREEFGYKNVHQVPRIEKVVLNVGLGRSISEKRYTEVATTTLRKITTQQPVQTKAKHSIAGFKLREGVPIGLKVTLRGQRMYEFIDRMISIVFPRLRDFRGLSRRAFDPHGNYSVGLPDQTVFAELSYDDTATTHGLQVNITTSAKDRAAGERLLELLGFPFEKLESAKAAQAEPVKGPVAQAVGVKEGGVSPAKTFNSIGANVGQSDPVVVRVTESDESLGGQDG